MTDWFVPRELDQALPRRTKPALNYRLHMGVGAFLLCAMGALLAIDGWLFALWYDQYKSLSVNGVAVDARVTDLDARRSVLWTHYNVTYRYGVIHRYRPKSKRVANTDSGDWGTQTYWGRSQTSARRFSHLRVGSTIPIVYNALDPAVSALNFGNRGLSRNPYLAALEELNLLSVLGPALLGMLYVFVLRELYKQFRREESLLRAGTVARATPVYENSSTEKDYPRSFRFNDADGHIVEYRPKVWKSGWFSRRRRLPYLSGTRTIIYDPKDSSVNFIYPSLLVDCIQPPD